MNWVAENLDSLLAPRETYLEHYEFMSGLTGELAEQVAAAGFALPLPQRPV
jgi:mortality factor 4-like protein 1